MLDSLLECLEQKKLLLENIVDLTRQIEVRCLQPEIDLEDFLEKRGGFMMRVDKCERLITVLAQQLPDGQRERILQILSGDSDGYQLDENEQRLIAIQSDCHRLRKQAEALDQAAHQALKAQYEDVKAHLQEVRGFNTNTMFFR